MTLVAVVFFAAVFTVAWGMYRQSHAQFYAFTSSLSSRWLKGDPSRELTALTMQRVTAASQLAPGRIVYPYSIVPGGVRDSRELQEAARNDTVVANHYENFNFRKASVIQLKQPKLVYLSYRIGDKVLWTKKRVALHKGEKLITDGKITARTRCANQVSEVAHANTSAQEPPVAKLEDPVTIAQVPTDFPSSLLSLPGISGAGPSGSSDMSEAAASIGPTFAGGIGSGSTLRTNCDTAGSSTQAGSSSGSKSSNSCAPGSVSTDPPTSVPEPGSVLMIAFALAGVVFGYRKASARI